MNDSHKSNEQMDEHQTFVEGLDFYFDDGMMVLCRRYLLNRGKCCGNGCRNCPFEDDPLSK